MQLPPHAPQPVVLDTNVVLDWQLFADPRAEALRRALDEGRLRWLASAAMVDELIDVLRRPLAARWEPRRERMLSLSPWREATLVEASSSLAHDLRCADPDDQKFLDLSLAHGVPWLVTRDRALLDLKRPAQRLGLTIVQPQHWGPLA